MATTEYDAIAELVSADQNAKSEFNPVSFDVLIHKINHDPELLKGDWRDLIRSEFELTAEEERSLVNVAEDRAKENQSSLTRFAELIGQGAMIQGSIIKRTIEEQTPEAVHGVQLEILLPESILSALNTPRMLRIAHCDANCRNWQWDSW